MKEAVQEHSRDRLSATTSGSRLPNGMHYVAMDFADEEREDRLAETLTKLDEERETRGNRVYYLATPPNVFETVVRRSASAARRRVGCG